MNLTTRCLALALVLTTTTAMLTGCGEMTRSKTADPVQVEQERQKYEEMARQERMG